MLHYNTVTLRPWPLRRTTRHIENYFLFFYWRDRYVEVDSCIFWITVVMFVTSVVVRRKQFFIILMCNICRLFQNPTERQENLIIKTRMKRRLKKPKAWKEWNDTSQALSWKINSPSLIKKLFKDKELRLYKHIQFELCQ